MGESRHNTKFNAERDAGRKRRTGHNAYIKKDGNKWKVSYYKRPKL